MSNNISDVINSYKGLCETLDAMGQNAPSLDDYPKCQYPNDTYTTIPLSQDDKVSIIGYGSLMKKCSGFNNVQAITDGTETYRPVAVLGVKRLFNYKDTYCNDQSKYPHEENERGMLNIARSKGSFMNAVSMRVNRGELARLVDREKGYDLVPVVFIDWKALITTGNKASFEIGYTFSASNDERLSYLDPKKNDALHRYYHFSHACVCRHRC